MAFFWVSPPHLEAREVLLETGHYDLAVNYTLEHGWKTYLRDYALGGGDLETWRHLLVAGEEAQTQVPSNPSFNFLGTTGAPLWILPEIPQPEVLYLGFGVPLLERNIFAGGLSNRGQLDLRLVSVTGSGPENGGHFILYQSDFPPRVIFNSADGIGQEDSLSGLVANFHAHYNFAFTAPGIYRVSFVFSGQLLPQHGGEYTEHQATFSFAVGRNPDPSPLRYAWKQAEGWEWSSWLGYFHRANAPWIYSFAHGWLYIPQGDPHNFWLWKTPDGWLWSSQDYFPWVWNPANSTWKKIVNGQST